MKIFKPLIIFCIILSLVVLILFFLNQEYCLYCPIATDIIGQYGDFVGGVIGTILSVVLLYFTLKSQIDEFKNSAKVFTKQQINDIFFHLLEQYNSIVNTFTTTYVQDEKDTILQGKEALHYFYLQIQENYRSSNQNKGRKTAVEFYSNFYSEHKDHIPTYFRTLYRIFDLIDTANIDELEKVRYAKIIRSQFTDTEIIILRYNAMTSIGENMRNYIVKYNLLKHTSPLNLLEYTQWRKLFTESMLNKANIVLYTIRKNIHTIIKEQKSTLAYTSTRAKYNINISRINDGKQIKVDFNRRTNIITPSYDDFFCFETITLENLTSLFETWLKEIFVFSNFGILNGSIMVEKNIIPSCNNQEHFSIKIISKNEKVLVV